MNAKFAVIVTNVVLSINFLVFKAVSQSVKLYTTIQQLFNVHVLCQDGVRMSKDLFGI